jgi:Fe2+ transport system protein B
MSMSYLVIFTIYIPCSATIATMVKEGSWKLALTHVGVSLSSAYILGIIFYWLTTLCL